MMSVGRDLRVPARLRARGDTHVELGAVVVVPAGEDLTGIRESQPFSTRAWEKSQGLHSSRQPILGNDVLRSWMERVRKLGLPSLWLTSSLPAAGADGSGTGTSLTGLLRQGIERLLVIKLKSYAELDLVDFLKFHRDSRNGMTEANDGKGHLGVCLIDQMALRPAEKLPASVSSSLDSEETPYQFRGYAKRISSGKERQELVGDALIGACALRPSGTQIREQVWIGEDVELATSARVTGPTYIGARAIIRAGATIGPFASIEHDCVVDCGTTVERSTVLPHTYLAPGLMVRNALVDGESLEDLNSGEVANLQETGLGSRIRARKSRRTASQELAEVFSRAWNTFAPPADASQTWVQVQL